MLENSGSTVVDEVELTYFGPKLLELRTAKGLSQKELGEAIGLSVNSVSLIESGQRKPSWGVAIRISRVLGVSLDVFLTPSSEAKKPGGRGRPRKNQEKTNGDD